MSVTANKHSSGLDRNFRREETVWKRTWKWKHMDLEAQHRDWRSALASKAIFISMNISVDTGQPLKPGKEESNINRTKL